MRRIPTLASRTWMLSLVFALLFVGWRDWRTAQRVDFVSRTDSERAEIDSASPTGYRGGRRWLIVPERNDRSYELIASTQQMLAGGPWRVRHLDWQNAPVGRDAYASAPARVWLGAVALGVRVAGPEPMGIAVERAALWSDPLLHLLLIISATVFVWRRFGSAAATVVALGLAAIYPFAGSFPAGEPDGHALAWFLAYWNVALLVSGCAAPSRESTPGQSNRSRQMDFALAGVAGGLGLWVDAASAVIVIGGLGIGGVAAGLLSSQGKISDETQPRPLPWRTWALAGGLTCLAAYAVEFSGTGVPPRLEVNHPLYGLAWLGLGELATQASAIGRNGISRLRAVTACTLAVAAIVALPAMMHQWETFPLFSLDLGGSRLAATPDAPAALNLGSWLHRTGLDLAVAATFLPWLLVVPAWVLGLRRPRSAVAGPFLIVGGAAILALAVATLHLRWWNLADAVLLASVPLVLAALPSSARIGMGIAAAAVVVPGMLALRPPPSRPGSVEFSRHETEDLIERELAHWLADHADAPGAIILTPPDRTASWCFHAGLRGVGTSDWENRDGLAATLAIIRATSVVEAQARVGEHQIAFVVLPSWDTDLDQFARWSLTNPEDAFVMALHHWAIPEWMRPMPFPLPSVPGFENQSVLILKVTDAASRVTALSNLAEYFLETRQPELAGPLEELLARFPTDPGALAARAEIERARHDPALAGTIDALVTSLHAGADRSLPWDRRINVAAALAASGQEELAREQLRRAAPLVEESGLRTLSPLALYRLLLLSRGYGTPLNEHLAALARQLLPAELRERLDH